MIYEEYYKRSENFDIFIATLFLTISFLNLYDVLFHPNLIITLVIILSVITGFLFHELAHRMISRKLGYRSYFKAWYEGLALSFLTSFIGIIIAAPGAVVILDEVTNKKDIVRISEAGPLINIIFSVIFLFLSFFFPPLIIASYINIALALFNLLPLGFGLTGISLDGFKIFINDTKRWIILFSISLFLFIYIIIL